MTDDQIHHILHRIERLLRCPDATYEAVEVSDTPAGRFKDRNTWVYPTRRSITITGTLPPPRETSECDAHGSRPCACRELTLIRDVAAGAKQSISSVSHGYRIALLQDVEALADLALRKTR